MKNNKPKKVFRTPKCLHSFLKNTQRVVVDGISTKTENLFSFENKNRVRPAVDFAETVLPVLPKKLQSRKNQLIYSDLVRCAREVKVLRGVLKKRLPKLQKLIPIICSMATKQSGGKKGILVNSKNGSNIFHCLDDNKKILSIIVFYHADCWLFRSFKFGEIGHLSKGDRVFRPIFDSRFKKSSFL